MQDRDWPNHKNARLLGRVGFDLDWFDLVIHFPFIADPSPDDFDADAGIDDETVVPHITNAKDHAKFLVPFADDGIFAKDHRFGPVLGNRQLGKNQTHLKRG